MSLTDLAVRKAAPAEKQYRIADGHGLNLLVHPNGSKYWQLRYRYLGKPKLLALGVYPDVSLLEARGKAHDAKVALAAGDDPGYLKRQTKRQRLEAHENSFELLAMEWWEAKRETLNADHAQRVLGYLKKDIFPELGSRPITQVDAADILAALRKVEKRGALDVAARLLQNISGVFSYAIQTGRAKYNPAQELKGVIKKRPVKNRPALRMAAMPEFLRSLRQSTANPATVLAVRLCVHTFCRPETIRHARWCDIDMEKKLWVVPVQFMKVKADRGGADHIVPLSRQVLELLEELRPITGRSQWLFPGERVRSLPMSEATMNQCINRLGYQGLATPSGFRTTACSYLNEQGFNRDAIERQMAHMERNAVRAAYIHHAEFLDERKRIMNFWSDHLENLETGNNVITTEFKIGRSG